MRQADICRLHVPQAACVVDSIVFYPYWPVHRIFEEESLRAFVYCVVYDFDVPCAASVIAKVPFPGKGGHCPEVLLVRHVLPLPGVINIVDSVQRVVPYEYVVGAAGVAPVNAYQARIHPAVNGVVVDIVVPDCYVMAVRESPSPDVQVPAVYFKTLYCPVVLFADSDCRGRLEQGRKIESAENRPLARIIPHSDRARVVSAADCARRGMGRPACKILYADECIMVIEAVAVSERLARRAACGGIRAVVPFHILYHRIREAICPASGVNHVAGLRPCKRRAECPVGCAEAPVARVAAISRNVITVPASGCFADAGWRVWGRCRRGERVLA
ncbi:Uncharacterised protein [uncultured archaeon]|nr:Uncharacterised protein [uncultured archaeon]